MPLLWDQLQKVKRAEGLLQENIDVLAIHAMGRESYPCRERVGTVPRFKKMSISLHSNRSAEDFFYGVKRSHMALQTIYIEFDRCQRPAIR